MRPVETIPGVKGGWGKENDGMNSSLRYFIRTFVNVIIYSQHNN
jgi:hypothetical protein